MALFKAVEKNGIKKKMLLGNLTYYKITFLIKIQIEETFFSVEIQQ